MAIEGPLRELGIHDVFQLLDLSRKTGVLRVMSELRHNQGEVHFDQGGIVSAAIRSNPHPLGTLLVRAGKIDEADLTHARDLQVRGDQRRLGQILVAIGAITERELARQVRQQIEEVVFEMMNWREGYFSFVEGPLADVPTDLAVRIPTGALLMEGARRIDEWSRIERNIPHLGMIPALAPPLETAGEGSVDLLPQEWEVLAAIDGARDIRSIAQFLGRSEFETAKTIFGFESGGIVMLREGAHPDASAGGPAQEDLRALGVSLAQRGRFSEAVDTWKKWLDQANGAEGAGERQRISQAIRAAEELEAALRTTAGG